MIGSLPLSAFIGLASFMQLRHVSANWDNATGHYRDRAPSPDWLKKNHPIVITKDIQVSECAMNTRTHFPFAQLYAWHFVNHSQDFYHGCAYGDCHAFTTFPYLNETVADFTNSNSFFWHHLNGEDNGIGVHPIANPQTGEFGYETSLKGKYIDGPAPFGEEQIVHDNNWPGWTKEAHKLVPQDLNMKILSTTEAPKQPQHPKCGLPCEPNKDPGQNPGSFGHYTPAPASAYQPPPDWTPGKNDTCCTKTGEVFICHPPVDFRPTPGAKNPPQKPTTYSCVKFCHCLLGAKSDKTKATCQRKHQNCSPQSCQTNPYPGKRSSKKHQKRRH